MFVEFFASPAGPTTNLSSKYKKLVLVATKDQQTVLKQELAACEEDHLLLQGLRVSYENLRNDHMLTFRLLAMQGGDKPPITLGMALVKVGALGLRTWQEVTSTAQMQGMSATCSLSSIKFKAVLVHSEFTRNPAKVLTLNFHRVLYLPPSGDSQPQIVLREQAISERVTMAGALLPAVSNDEERGGEEEDNSGLSMRVEFENCLKNRGMTDDYRSFELNNFGKPPYLRGKTLNRVEIYNTRYDAEVKFKLCVGRTESVAGAVVADASFRLAQVMAAPN